MNEFEFENLLNLFDSTEISNVDIAFQQAANYKQEFEQHFRCSIDMMKKLFDFVIKHKIWDFKKPFYELNFTEIQKKKFKRLPKEFLINSTFFNSQSCFKEDVGIVRYIDILFIYDSFIFMGIEFY